MAEVSELLGVTEEEPIDFFIYADQDAFYAALGPSTRENVGGEAHADIRTMFALITPSEINDDWVEVVVPHELTHLVFDTATDNPYHAPPHWLNEGVAVYLSEGYTSGDRALVENAARAGTIMPLEGLVGAFPTTRDRFFLAYAESVSAVDDIVADHGQDALVGLIRSYADGVSDDEAFTAALGMDVAAFEQSWLEGPGCERARPARAAAGAGRTAAGGLVRGRPERDAAAGRHAARDRAARTRRSTSLPRPGVNPLLLAGLGLLLDRGDRDRCCLNAPFPPAGRDRRRGTQPLPCRSRRRQRPDRSRPSGCRRRRPTTRPDGRLRQRPKSPRRPTRARRRPPTPSDPDDDRPQP